MARDPDARLVTVVHQSFLDAIDGYTMAEAIEEDGLLLVGAVRRLGDAHLHAVLASQRGEGLHVLRETGPAIADAGPQEARPDPLVQPHTARDVLHVRAGQLADPAHSVDERDLRGQERVRRVLRQFRCW